MNKTTELQRFTAGKNNVAPDTDLPENSLVEALNVDLDEQGNAYRRSGYTKIYSGSDIHSLFERYFVENTYLKYCLSVILIIGFR